MEAKVEEDGRVDEVVEEVGVIGNNEERATEMKKAEEQRTANNS